MEALIHGGVIALGLCVLALLTAMHWVFWTRYFRLETHEDEVHRVVCDDGWEVCLYHYRGASSRQGDPVILCHGYCANRFNVDFGDASLARYLRGQGWDVWVLELRGCADATRTPPPGVARGAVFFEDFVERDMPAVIRHVMGHTGAEGVHWVGHSMGGMIALAFAQGPLAELLKSITAIGSPSRLALSASVRLLCRAACLLGWLRELPVGTLSQIAAPWYFWLPVDPMAIRTANVRGKSVRRAMSNVLSNMPMGLTRQLAQMQVRGGAVVVRDGRDYTAGLHSIECPLLCIAGGADRVAPPPVVRIPIDQAAASETRWVEVGASEGVPAYGHGDLLIGDRAVEHVFPHVDAWLCQRAQGQNSHGAESHDKVAAPAQQGAGQVP